MWIDFGISCLERQFCLSSQDAQAEFPVGFFIFYFLFYFILLCFVAVMHKVIFTDIITFLGTMVRENIWHCMEEFSRNQTSKFYLICEEKSIQEYPRVSEGILKNFNQSKKSKDYPLKDHVHP